MAELLAECLAGQVVVGHLADVPAHLAGDVPGHGEGAAHLEGVEAEAERLILHEQVAQAQVSLAMPSSGRQRRDGILGKAVEESSLGHVPQGHDGKLPVVGGHPIGDPFDQNLS